MAGPNDIDEDVRRFILDRIKSFEHLEILLLLVSHSNRTWSSAEVSQKLRNSETSALQWLEDLYNQGLAKRHQLPSGCGFTYKLDDRVDAMLIAKLSKTYAERRVSVINLIFSKPLEKIQVFADAFQIIKKDGK